MSGSASNLLRAVTPGRLRRAIGLSKHVAERIVRWTQAFVAIRGVSDTDRAIVRRSMIATPKVLLQALDDWQEPQLVEDAVVAVKGLGSFHIRGRSDDLGHVVPANFVSVAKIVAETLRAGDIAVDAGANIGVVTVLMGRAVGGGGQVVAIEMMPDTAASLRENITLNALGNVRVVEAALADQAGLTVTAIVAPGAFGQATILKHFRPAADIIQHDVLTTTLDAVTASVGRIGLLKMDLEGAEAAALAGAVETLKRVDAVLFESWDADGGEAAAILRAAGFTLSRIDARNMLARNMLARARATP